MYGGLDINKSNLTSDLKKLKSTSINLTLLFKSFNLDNLIAFLLISIDVTFNLVSFANDKAIAPVPEPISNA